MRLPHSNRLAALLTVTLLSILGTANLAANGDATRLLRSPTISATHVAFAYANNIWVAERAGGVARRVTSFQGQTTNPKFSPDGKTIAFSSEYAGNTDVYAVPVDGGEPTRLTWHPGADTVQGWTPDGARIVFASGRATLAPNAAPRFWTVALNGGPEEALALPRAYQGKISPDGRRVAYRVNTSWDEERRNYRGGQNKPIWIVDLKTYDLVTPPWTDSKDIDPVWVGETVYFISDRDGVANVWSYDVNGKKLTQQTRFTDFDVKSLDAGGGAVVFEQAGLVHELDPKNGRSKPLSIRVAGDFPWMMPRWEDVTARMTNIALSPTGKRVLTEARGEIFTIPAEKGDIRNITNSSASAERSPAWSPDGKWISYFSDKSGEYKLVIESQDGIGTPREIAFDKPAFYYTPSWSPDSRKLLYADTNLNVLVIDIARGKTRSVGRDLDGAAAHAVSGLESGLEVGGLRQPSQHALSRHRRRRRGARRARRQRRATRGHDGSDLPPGAVARFARALRRPPGLRARRHAVRHDGRSIGDAGPAAGAAHGQPDRQDRPHQPRRHRADGQPVRRQGRRAAQKSGRSATAISRRRRCTRPAANCGRASTARAAATK